MMTHFDAAILGIVEGITEYLPVSSTGHLIIAGRFLNLPESEALKSYDIVIQFGAILAVVGLYREQVLKMFKGLFGKDKDGLHLFICLVISCLPIMLIGLPLKSKIEESLFSVKTVAWALLLGGVVMIAIETLLKKTQNALELMTYRAALLIGLVQCLALIPGTSRSMVTIFGAILCGFSRKKAAEYSFLLALPVLSGACLIGFLESHEVILNDFGMLNVLIGMSVSCLVAALSIQLLITVVNRFGFIGFGVYRILAGIFIMIYLL